MIITDWIHCIAGFIIVASLLLGVEISPIFVSRYWLLLTLLVGLNLFQFGLTKFCPMTLVLRRFGIPETRR